MTETQKRLVSWWAGWVTYSAVVMVGVLAAVVSAR